LPEDRSKKAVSRQMLPGHEKGKFRGKSKFAKSRKHLNNVIKNAKLKQLLRGHKGGRSRSAHLKIIYDRRPTTAS